MPSPSFRALLLAAHLIAPGLAAAQAEYRVELSPELYGLIVLTNPDASFSPGSVTIHSRKDDSELIRVISSELTLTLHGGRALPNIRQFPFGEQSAIQYVDVNFDGVKDLAIMDGQKSDQHAPSFKVYLGDKADPTHFTYSVPFSMLAQKYSGMFRIDAREKRLHTVSKVGCCWRQDTSFWVIDGQPRSVDIVERDVSTPGLTIQKESKWNGREMADRKDTKMDLAALGSELILSFAVEGRDAKVVLFRSCGERLSYALLRAGGHVDFLYPEASCAAGAAANKTAFRFESDALMRWLVFGNASALYTVYENLETGEFGISILQDGKKPADWKARPDSVQGDLELADYPNVQYHRR